MPIAIEKIELAHEGIKMASVLARRLARLANSGPVGFERAVRVVQELATTADGVQALKNAHRYVFQHNQSNLAFQRSSAGKNYSLRIAEGGTRIHFGDGVSGKRLPAATARKIVATYRYGDGKK